MQDEEAVSGRSLIFTIPKKEKEKIKLSKLSKKIEKKEKRIKTLAQSVKNTFAEQEKIIKKKKNYEEEILKASNQIEEEKSELSMDQISNQVENLYH